MIEYTPQIMFTPVVESMIDHNGFCFTIEYGDFYTMDYRFNNNGDYEHYASGTRLTCWIADDNNELHYVDSMRLYGERPFSKTVTSGIKEYSKIYQYKLD